MENICSSKTCYLVLFSLLFSLFFSCQEDLIIESTIDPVTNDDSTGSAVEGLNLTDWTTETHSNSADPNYDVVFDQTQVNRIDIVITSDEYQTMRTDLASLSSSFAGNNFTDETPVYVAADFYFNDIQWYNVGLRYKGNSSLFSAYSSRIGKLPLRLKFDKFEDDYPEITNQRFYGFKDLSLSSGYNDESFMREKTATDLFREFGIPAPQTAYYEVWVDHGTGTAIYYGLYTMVEVVFDTMLDEQFGSEDGNCYKPDGDGAKFASSGFDLDDFEKKTNEDEGDWSDIQALYDVLHDGSRTTNESEWKSDLESVFDVNHFLKYLAVNNTIQNWDTYGNMTHNYYLYHDPADGLIKWIPWDNNEAFSSGSGRSGSALSFEMSEVSSEWPLIDYLIDVEEYRATYDAYIAEFITDAFDPDKMAIQYEEQNALIYSSATSEVSGYSFISGSSEYTSAVSAIKAHCSSRNTAAENYLK